MISIALALLLSQTGVCKTGTVCNASRYTSNTPYGYLKDGGVPRQSDGGVIYPYPALNVQTQQTVLAAKGVNFNQLPPCPGIAASTMQWVSDKSCYYICSTAGWVNLCDVGSTDGGSAIGSAVAPLQIVGSTISAWNAAAGDGGAIYVSASDQTATLATNVPGSHNVCDWHINSIQSRTDGNRMCWEDQGAQVAWIDNIGDVIANASVRVGISKVEGIVGVLDFQSHRTAADPSADFRFYPKTGVSRAFGNDFIEVQPQGLGTTDMAIGSFGEVYAAGDTHAAGDFISLQSDPQHPTLTCNGGIGGCYLILSGGMLDTNNAAFHGIVTIGNGGPQTADGGVTVNPYRDGGLWLQGQGTGGHNANSGTFPHTLTAADDFGDWWFRDGYLQSTVDIVDQRSCESSLVWDGHIHNSAGAFAFITQNDTMNLCTGTSAAADGGFEHLCTDLNGKCGTLDSQWSGYYDGTALGSSTLINQQRFYQKVTSSRLTFTPTSPSVDAVHAYTVQFFDLTSSTAICSSTSIACNAAGPTSVNCTGTSNAAGDDLQLIINDGACTSALKGNATVSYH